MERKFKWMARRSILATSIMWWFLSLLIISMVSVPIFIIKYSHENNFDFTILFWIFGIVSCLTLLCIVLRLIFISTTHLVYGKIVDIEDSSPEDTQVYHNFVIEYTDPYGNECQTRFYEQFGDNLEDMEKILNTQPGFIHAMWCGDVECENRIKEIKGCKSRCIVEDGEKIDDKCVCCGKEAKHHVIWGIQY